MGGGGGIKAMVSPTSKRRLGGAQDLQNCKTLLYLNPTVLAAVAYSPVLFWHVNSKSWTPKIYRNPLIFMITNKCFLLPPGPFLFPKPAWWED